MDNDRILIDGKIYYQLCFDDMIHLAHCAFMLGDSLSTFIPEDCCKDRVFLICSFKNDESK